MATLMELGGGEGRGGEGLPIRCELEVKTQLGPIHHNPLIFTFFLNESILRDYS
jgi:hypothetical protein